MKLVGHRPTDSQTDRPTTRPNDRPTDIVLYRADIAANNEDTPTYDFLQQFVKDRITIAMADGSAAATHHRIQTQDRIQRIHKQSPVRSTMTCHPR